MFECKIWFLRSRKKYIAIYFKLPPCDIYLTVKGEHLLSLVGNVFAWTNMLQGLVVDLKFQTVSSLDRI